MPSSQRIPCGAAGLTPSVCFGEPRTSSAPASKCASLAGPPVQFLPLDSPVCNTPADPVDCGVKASMRNPRQRQARGDPSERRRQPLPGDAHRTAVASAAPSKLDRRWRTYSNEEEAPTPPLKACVTRCLARRGFPLGVVSENTKTVAAMLSVIAQTLHKRTPRWNLTAREPGPPRSLPHARVAFSRPVRLTREELRMSE